jgi:hypothetical protein
MKLQSNFNLKYFNVKVEFEFQYHFGSIIIHELVELYFRINFRFNCIEKDFLVLK